MTSNAQPSIFIPKNAIKISAENKFGISIWLLQCSFSKKQILFTNGMSQFNQKKYADDIEFIYPFIELYFLLPTYWDINKPNQKWPIKLITKLANIPNVKNTWFGPGDTMMANRNEKKTEFSAIDSPTASLNQVDNSINDTFKQQYLILNEPIAGEGLLDELSTKNINWLSVMPIFKEEFEYKQSHSAFELFDHFNRKKITEEIDRYRGIAIKKRFFGLF